MEHSTAVQPKRQPSTITPPVVAPHRPSITQSTLASILKQRRELKEAEKAVKALKGALAERERSVDPGPPSPSAS